MKGVFATIKMSAAGKLNSGVLALFAGYSLKIAYLLPIVFLWRSFAARGADLGSFTLEKLLTYACASSMLGQLLNVQTGAVTWHYDGGIIDLYRRPRAVFGQLIAKTAGGWLPELLLFSLPMAVILPFFGVTVVPASAWFLPCLALSVSLGFATDFLFTCFIIRLQNAMWTAYSIRSAVTSLLSGAVIPLALLPWGLAAAPLAVFTGTAAPQSVMPLQIFWNAILWPLASLAFRKSQERMTSYGG
jgi:ABC-2 type transport system permease protein